MASIDNWSLDITIKENSKSGNKTNVTVAVYLKSNEYGWAYSASAQTGTLKIDGTTYSFSKAYDIGTNSSLKLYSKTLDITHNSDGKKTLETSATFNLASVGTVSASESKVLTPIAAYTLTISAGTGSSIVVNRTSSAGGGSTGKLSNGAKLYKDDKLKITFSASANYSIETHTVNGSTFTSGNTHTVSKNVTVKSTAKQLRVSTLLISPDDGSYITVNRTSSTQGETGILSNNAALYANDKLKISFAPKTNYKLLTHTVNGSSFASGETYTVSSSTPATLKVKATSKFNISTISVDDDGKGANVGDKVTLVVTRPDTSYYHSIRIILRDKNGNDIEGTNQHIKYDATSGEWVASGEKTAKNALTQEEILDLRLLKLPLPSNADNTFYDSMASLDSATVHVTIYTYDDPSNDNIGTYSTDFKVYIDKAANLPVVTPSCVDTNNLTISITGDNTVFIKGMSTVVSSVDASSKNKATLQTVSIKTPSGTTKSVSGAGNASVSTSCSETPTSNGTYTFSATDTRGFSTTSKITPDILTVSANNTEANPSHLFIDYYAPSVSAEFKRTTPTGGTVSVAIAGKWYGKWFNKDADHPKYNELRIQYHFREDGTTAWSNWIDLGDAGLKKGFATFYTEPNSPIELSSEFDYRKAFDIQLRLLDGKVSSNDQIEWIVLSDVQSGDTWKVQPGVPVFDWSYDNFNSNVPVTMQDGLGVYPHPSISEDGEQFDLNDFTEPGYYTFVNGKGTVLNAPYTLSAGGASGWLIVQQSHRDAEQLWIRQTWHRAGTVNSNDSDVFVRSYYYGSGWSNWDRYLTRRRFYYQVGDSVDLHYSIVSGFLTSSKGAIHFFVPLSKPVDSSVTTANLSGEVYIRHADGGLIASGVQISSIGSLASSTITDTGVYYQYTLSAASTFTNNAPIVIYGGNNFKITFTNT